MMPKTQRNSYHMRYIRIRKCAHICSHQSV